MANFKIMRNGLNTEIVGDPHIGQSSEDVTVTVTDDGTYQEYDKKLYYSYCYRNQIYRAIADKNSSGEFIIPMTAFLEPGLIKLSVELSNGTNKPTCNACFIIATNGAKSVAASDILPDEETWQSYIQSYLKSDIVHKPTVDALEKRIDNLILSSGTESSAELQDVRVGYDGKVYPTAGDAVREQVVQIMQQGSNSGSGITEDAKVLLLCILRNGIYKSDQSANITALGVALDSEDVKPSGNIYAVTNNLSGVTTDNTRTYAIENSTYVATLSVPKNSTIENVTITMGGVNITDDVYVDGVITITSVAGDVVITATASVVDLMKNATIIEDEYCKIDGTILTNQTNYARTDYIDVSGCTKLVLTTRGNGWIPWGIRFFDKDKTFLKSHHEGTDGYLGGNYHEFIEVEIPDGCKYMICSNTKQSMSSIVIKAY